MTRYDEFCETVTAQIVASIESGDADVALAAPWHRLGTAWAPRNAKTSNYYGGSNVVVLASEALDADKHNEWSSPWWATYNQWSDLGAQVRKGERATRIVKWVPKRARTDDTDRPTGPSGQPMSTIDDLKPSLVPKVYAVFNHAQIDGWQPPDLLSDHDPIEAAEAWISASGAEISYGHDHACYVRTADRIEVPAPAQFPDQTRFYSVTCHELIHWTGHETRLARTFGERFGDDAYAAEELVAELGAAFSCARLGLDNKPRTDHAAYLNNWLHILKADPKALFTTASAAQTAVGFLETKHHNHIDPSTGTNVVGSAA